MLIQVGLVFSFVHFALIALTACCVHNQNLEHWVTALAIAWLHYTSQQFGFSSLDIFSFATVLFVQ